MAHAKKIIQAIKIKMKMDKLAKAKEDTLRDMVGLEPKEGFFAACCTSVWNIVREKACAPICACLTLDTTSPHMPKPCRRVFGKRFKEFGRNTSGFLIGCLLTQIFYYIMAWQLEFDSLVSLIVSYILSTILTFGLAFSTEVRCVIALMLPQLFSGKGRAFLLSYAVVLVLTHPVTNVQDNILVMSQSATCGQSMAYNQTKQLLKTVSSPGTEIVDVLKGVLESMKMFALQLRQTFLALKKNVQEISDSIRRAGSWLASMKDECNEKMSSPYRKCREVFDRAHSKCMDSFWIFGYIICWPCKLLRECCVVARVTELLCVIANAVINYAMKTIGEPALEMIEDVYDMFYFNVTFRYNYTMQIEQSKSYDEIKRDILKEIKEKVDEMRRAVDLTKFISILTAGFLFFKGIIYRWKFLTKDRFDNIYITKEFKEINIKRIEREKETALPLEHLEVYKYIDSFSIRLTAGELTNLTQGLLFWFLCAIHASFYLMCDYGLYWVLVLVRKYLSIKTHVDVPPHMKIQINGEGPMADIYRKLIMLFDPLAAQGIAVDTSMCLPEPFVPDYKVYGEIGALFLICFILLWTEAYGLRLRHVVAGRFFPDRKKERAIWLYNHILRMRGGFTKYFRRKLRREQMGDTGEAEQSAFGHFGARLPIIGRYFRANSKVCIGCGREGPKSDIVNFKECDNYDCNGVYCNDCFDGLGNICTICMNPVDYGDVSDQSEERDSSDDAEEIERMKAEAQEVREKRKAALEERRASKVLDKFHAFANIDTAAIHTYARTQYGLGSSAVFESSTRIAGGQTETDDSDVSSWSDEDSLSEALEPKPNGSSVFESSIRIAGGQTETDDSDVSIWSDEDSVREVPKPKPNSLSVYEPSTPVAGGQTEADSVLSRSSDEDLPSEAPKSKPNSSSVHESSTHVASAQSETNYSVLSSSLDEDSPSEAPKSMPNSSSLHESCTHVVSAQTETNYSVLSSSLDEDSQSEASKSKPNSSSVYEYSTHVAIGPTGTNDSVLSSSSDENLPSQVHKPKPNSSSAHESRRV